LSVNQGECPNLPTSNFVGLDYWGRTCVNHIKDGLYKCERNKIVDTKALLGIDWDPINIKLSLDINNQLIILVEKP
jgi:hypothetical protein